MKNVDWIHWKNFYYKLLTDKVLVIELHKKRFCLDIYSQKKLELLYLRQFFKTLTEAFVKTSELEKGYIIQKI